jgi:GntR family transcriptional regulator
MIFNTSIPIYLQVVDDIKKQITLGYLKSGEKMLSTRDLALRYQINPNTAMRIYKELEIQNICIIKRGLGSFVTDSEETIKKLKKEMAEEIIELYIKNMKELGYSFTDMKKFIEEREGEKNGIS